MTHPLQPLVWDENIIRFKSNKIVEYLLDAGPFDMNHLALLPFSNEDREQFAQLIGYSVSGWGDLSYVSEDRVVEADALSAELIKERNNNANNTKNT